MADRVIQNDEPIVFASGITLPQYSVIKNRKIFSTGSGILELITKDGST